MAGKAVFDFRHYGLDNFQPAEEISLAIYRVMQEHLTNVVKHADATKVQISLSSVADHILLLIIDNGDGFDVKKKRQGIGIANMFNRVETLNGRLDLKSVPGEGSTLLAVIPLRNLD